ncbi:hypothetical protein BMJ27_07465 [Sinorhizobium medicae]|uniref:phage major capsid protein n=1 Tax=Sinorhizobium medicae TaxID=110321 RepID=UPI000C7DD3F4|nr:phage major capsid protein [Sinorhizobium medicae]PLU37992.1 hypothetical protein BMJ27_07465 [Sinorhizobium medicae]
MTIERLEIKAALTASDDGTIEGIAWPFGSTDLVGDQIEPKAFASATAPLPLLFQHDEPVGVWDEIKSTAEGLVMKGRLLINSVARAAEVRSLIVEKAVQGLSIGFVTEKASPRKGGGRLISQLSLKECSVVAVPCNPDARITFAKDLNMTATAAENTIDTKALNDLDAKLTARLDAIEAKAQRLEGANDNDAPVDTKAISDWAKTGKLEGADTKTLVVGTPSAGGYTVAPEYRADVIKKITELNPIRQLAGVTSVGTNKVYWPVLNSDAAGTWIGETAARTEDEPDFAQVGIDIFEHAVIVPISRQLLEDSFVDMAGLLAERIAVGFAKAESTAFLTGTGTGEPSGILDALASLGGINETADVIADIVDLYYSLPTQYAMNGSWLLSRPTIAKIRKAADTSTQRGTIWSDSLAVGTPPRLLGAPVYEAPGLATHDNSGASTVGASALFGDFSAGFRVVDRVGLEVLRDDLTGAANGIVKFHARKRVGSSVVLPESIVALRG